MWYLTSETDKRILYILQNKNITIGRSIDGQNCNFAISDDPSISRKHATLLISNYALFVKDVGSKYGTYINNAEKLNKDEMKNINLGDTVKFGKIGCVWTVCKMDFVTCTSTLKGEHLQNLKTVLNKLGGTLKNDWDESCLYLTMPSITLTIKVVLALVQNSRIVNVEYWNKCIEAINNNNPLPDPNSFVPQILESTLNKENVSFLPNNNRTSIFAGKKVIFFSRKQLDMYRTVLLKSSASTMLLSESKMTKSALCDSNVIVIQYNLSSSSQETQAQRDQIKEIIDLLKSKGKRVVADAEIGLAVLYCSTSKYCNPEFNFSSEVIKQAPNQHKPKNILAFESQEPSQAVCKQEDILIDESLTSRNVIGQCYVSSTENSGSSKRKLSDENGDATKCTKKVASENTKHINLGLSKKRNAQELDEIENPSKKVALQDEDDGGMFKFTKSIPAINNDHVSSNKLDEIENPSKKVALQDEDDGGMFKFTKSIPAINNDHVSSNKLNFSKPLKRKHVVEDEDDLFNFVNKKTAAKTNNVLKSESSSSSNIIKPLVNEPVDENVDLNALRGSKLNELDKLNSDINLHKIKKENISLIDEKLCNVNIGSTTLIIKKDLIIKREPLQIESLENGLKNFKKFKKVWPVKMRISMVSNSVRLTSDDSTVNLNQIVS